MAITERVFLPDGTVRVQHSMVDTNALPTGSYLHLSGTETAIWLKVTSDEGARIVDQQNVPPELVMKLTLLLG